MDPLGIIASTIAVVQATTAAYKAIQHISGLPNEFNEVNRNLPLAQGILHLARDRLQDQAPNEPSRKALQPLISGCEEKAKALHDIFERVEKGVKNNKDGSILDFYRLSLLRLGKANRVETLMQGILKDLDVLATNQLFKTATHSQVAQLDVAIGQLSKLKSSVSDTSLDDIVIKLTQNVATGGTGHQTHNSGQGQYIVSGSGTMNSYNAHSISFVENSASYKIRKEVLQALHTSPYLDRKNRNPDRVPGTCEWFVGHNHFKQWQSCKSSSMLWVSANPGCGKSVLAKYLVDVLPTTESRTTSYFFFKDDFEDQRSAKGALSCILHQLFTQREELLSDKIVKRFDSYNVNIPSSVHELWEILVLASQHENAGDILCIMDAFDECEDSERRELSQALRKFYDTENNTRNQTCLKFVVTSRPYDKIGRGFQPLELPGLPIIHLKGESEAEISKIAREIEVYIIDRVTRIREDLHLDRNDKEMLLQKLRDIPNRTYLWVYLTLDLIKEEVENDLDIGQSAVLKTLSSIPRSVDEAYERILAKSSNKEKAKKLLHIVVAAARPLTLTEMDMALALRQEHTGYKDWNRKPEELFGRYVRELCGLFITITESKIYLLHQTAKEFLVGKDLPDRRQEDENKFIWKSSLRPIDSHRILCHICIWHLLFTEFETQPRNEVPNRSVPNKAFCDQVFLDYSATNWAAHFRASDIKEHAILESLLEICDTSSTRCRTWFSIYWAKTHSEFPWDFTTLMIASYFGLNQIVKLLLEKHDTHIDSIDSTYQRTALSWASENGFNGVVKLLTKGQWIHPRAISKRLFPKGAEIDTRDKFGRTPLSYAAWNGYITIVERLVRAGARVDSTDEIGGTPISYALCTGQVAVADRLIKGAQIDSVDKIKRDLLFSAVTKGREVIVERLLDHGAVAELVDMTGRTPLSLAAEHGHDSVAKLLLENGAEINSKDKYGQTPLLWAAKHGHESLVKRLFQEGADGDSKDNKGRTPLEFLWAAKKRDTNIIKLLLQKSTYIGHSDADGCTPLSWAVENDYEDTVELLVEKRGEVNSMDTRGRTPLSWAVENGHERIVKILLEKGAAVDSKDMHGWTPLAWPAEAGYEGIVKMLLRKGANVDSKDCLCQTPLSLACENGHSGVVERLLEKGADVDTKDREYNRTPLWHAARKGYEGIVRLLLDKGAEVNIMDRNGRTPLWHAAEKGHESIVELLLSKGTDINLRDIHGRTSLSWAAGKGYEKIVQLLLDKGSDVNSKDKYNRTPLWSASENGHETIVKQLIAKGAKADEKDIYGWRPLFWTAEKAYKSIAKLLLNQGAEINSEDAHNWTPLWCAARRGHEGMVKLFLEKGASVSLKDRDYGRTPLCQAAENGSESIVNLLLNQGAEVNVKDGHGQAALSLAASKGYENMANFLLEQGAEINSKDQYGQTPLSCAAKNGHISTVQLLLDKGADVSLEDKIYVPAEASRCVFHNGTRRFVVITPGHDVVLYRVDFDTMGYDLN